ncbi:helix-turn-helix domain-containing protein [Candidatus Pacearchaeota archaeon]|nr:helix-turn-helix domain-containing protein [Candidatus Pacearchaeota archaeon]
MPNKERRSAGLFLCPHCGEEVERLLAHGRKNKSCGCARSKNVTTHGLTRGGKKHPLFQILRNMKARCQNKNYISYHRYGGRGISICKEWLDDPQEFFTWGFANGWKRGLEIDRIDNDGGYSPENCRFTTRQQNCNNRSTTKLSYELADTIRKTYRKSGKSQEETAKDFGVSRSTIRRVIKNQIWRKK